MQAADATVVVLVPGLGDDIQAIKAGILEIADVFVVNKADREGADRVVAELAMMLDLSPAGRLAAADREDVGAVGGGRARGDPRRSRRTAASGASRGKARGGARCGRARGCWPCSRSAIPPDGRGPRSGAGRARGGRGRGRGAARGSLLGGRPPLRAVRPGRRGSAGEVGRVTAYRIDHLGIAVASIDEALGGLPGARARSRPGAKRCRRRRSRPRSCRSGRAASSCSSRRRRTLRSRSSSRSAAEGIHHVCFAVDDIEAALADLAGKGFRLIHSSPVPGADGKRVAFLHPEAGRGVLIELAEAVGEGTP